MAKKRRVIPKDAIPLAIVTKWLEQKFDIYAAEAQDKRRSVNGLRCVDSVYAIAVYPTSVELYHIPTGWRIPVDATLDKAVLMRALDQWIQDNPSRRWLGHKQEFNNPDADFLRNVRVPIKRLANVYRMKCSELADLSEKSTRCIVAAYPYRYRCCITHRVWS